MGFFRDAGKIVNKVGGGLATGSIKVISKAVSTKNEKLGQYVGELGYAVVDASKTTIDNLGQFTDGTVQGAYGMIKKDEFHKQQGWKNMKESTGRTTKGIGFGIYTVKSTGITVNGIKNGNRDEAVRGVKNLGKVAAVTAFAVGVIDLVGGTEAVVAEEIETRNDHLKDVEQAETGVSFVEKRVEQSNGELTEGTFPVFDTQFSAVLAEELFLENDNTHFQIANDTLHQSIVDNLSLANELGLSTHDVQNLANGNTPEGYVWHHNEQPGVLQLVDEETHQNTGHKGGREIWGGGSHYR